MNGVPERFIIDHDFVLPFVQHIFAVWGENSIEPMEIGCGGVGGDVAHAKGLLHGTDEQWLVCMIYGPAGMVGDGGVRTILEGN